MNGDNFHSELLVLLKNAHDDIERAKHMGWRDFYYVLAAIGAVTGLYRAVDNHLNFPWMHLLFFLAPLALMILGICLVWATQRTLDQRRRFVDACYKNLDAKIQEILNGPLGEPVNRALYPWLFRGVTVLTATFSTIIMVGLWLSKPC